MKFIWFSCVVTVFACAVVGRNVVDTNNKSIVDGRIVGGEKARIEDYPYQVYLGGCGGSILSSRVIITAAHCTFDKNEKNIKVYAGSSLLFGGAVSDVYKIINHENYNSITQEYDVSLLILTEPLNFTNSIQPIGLPEDSEDLRVGELAVATGWGSVNVGGPSSKILQKVEVPIVDQNECVEAYTKKPGYPYPITSLNLCAGYLGIGGKDACQGDSGGPLASNGKLYGITSHGYSCAKKDFPGVYTRITAVVPWIQSKLNLYK